MKHMDDDDFERGEETMDRDSLPPLDDLVMTQQTVKSTKVTNGQGTESGKP